MRCSFCALCGPLGSSAACHRPARQLEEPPPTSSSCRLWDVSSGQCLEHLQGHQGPIWSMQYDGARVASCDDEGAVRLWDLGTHRQGFCWQGREGGFTWQGQAAASAGRAQRAASAGKG